MANLIYSSQRMAKFSHLGVICLLIALGRDASAVTIPTTFVGNAGNLPDATGYGAVPYAYRIGTHEVTNDQYTEFLNAVDPGASNSLRLYDSNMSVDAHGGIGVNSLAAVGQRYNAKPGYENKPVTFVDRRDAIRFVNWLHNGQGSGGTEDGAYTIPDGELSVTRSANARWWLPSENEWYKAAYHKNDGPSGNYWDYPTSSDAPPYSAPPPGTAAPDITNTANFFKQDNVANGYNEGYAFTSRSPTFGEIHLTDVGSYPQSRSPYGTFDQGGNLAEIFESSSVFNVLTRGGAWQTGATISGANALHSSTRLFWGAAGGSDYIGFRVAATPEPSGGSLAYFGLAAVCLFFKTRRGDG